MDVARAAFCHSMSLHKSQCKFVYALEREKERKRERQMRERERGKERQRERVFVCLCVYLQEIVSKILQLLQVKKHVPKKVRFKAIKILSQIMLIIKILRKFLLLIFPFNQNLILKRRGRLFFIIYRTKDEIFGQPLRLAEKEKQTKLQKKNNYQRVLFTYKMADW